MGAGVIIMPKYQVQGPDPDGNYFVVCNEARSSALYQSTLLDTFDTKETAQAAADALNADPQAQKRCDG